MITYIRRQQHKQFKHKDIKQKERPQKYRLVRFYVMAFLEAEFYGDLVYKFKKLI